MWRNSVSVQYFFIHISQRSINSVHAPFSFQAMIPKITVAHTPRNVAYKTLKINITVIIGLHKVCLNVGDG